MLVAQAIKVSVSAPGTFCDEEHHNIEIYDTIKLKANTWCSQKISTQL